MIDPSPTALPTISEGRIRKVADDLGARQPRGLRESIDRGVRQVAERWWAEDGDDRAFAAFCVQSFVADPEARSEIFSRLEGALEQIDGHVHEIRRELRRPVDLATGPVRPVDLLLQNLDLGSHVDEDLYRTKTAFLALLHFPVHTLEERLRESPSWSRSDWARSRLMDRFAERIPPHVIHGIVQAMSAAELYISEYNIAMDRLRTADGRRPFPQGLRLISHWGLRDDLKSRYAEGIDGFAEQQLTQRVMERIVRQEIPAAFLTDAGAAWCPETNDLAGAEGLPVSSEREPDRRYERWLGVFRALREADRYSPAAPTFVRRRFELDRQIPEADVESLLTAIAGSGEVGDLGRRIESRLGRPLEPFDIWYSGDSARREMSEAELDRIVKRRYPTAEAFQSDLPGLLQSLGFSEERSRWLSERIIVDASRGAGHALGAVRREDRSHLRMRVDNGMSYRSFNIAMHELGHCVEQVFSLNAMDHWSLNGVPNTAFTEAFAFTFQARDLEVLGHRSEGAEERHRKALRDLWTTFEIAGVSLLDMRVWNWMYAHPGATPAELREAVLHHAREIWNGWFAPVLGRRDVELLAIYSHLISAALYTPDYAVGELVAFQIGTRLRDANFGVEVERMTRQGRLTPDAWMRGATGESLSARPLLEAARAALRAGV